MSSQSLGLLAVALGAVIMVLVSMHDSRKQDVTFRYEDALRRAEQSQERLQRALELHTAFE